MYTERFLSADRERELIIPGSKPKVDSSGLANAAVRRKSQRQPQPMRRVPGPFSVPLLSSHPATWLSDPARPPERVPALRTSCARHVLDETRLSTLSLIVPVSTPESRDPGSRSRESSCSPADESRPAGYREAAERERDRSPVRGPSSTSQDPSSFHIGSAPFGFLPDISVHVYVDFREEFQSPRKRYAR